MTNLMMFQTYSTNQVFKFRRKQTYHYVFRSESENDIWKLNPEREVRYVVLVKVLPTVLGELAQLSLPYATCTSMPRVLQEICRCSEEFLMRPFDRESMFYLAAVMCFCMGSSETRPATNPSTFAKNPLNYPREEHRGHRQGDAEGNIG
jgi:hypothetical protein